MLLICKSLKTIIDITRVLDKSVHHFSNLNCTIPVLANIRLGSGVQRANTSRFKHLEPCGINLKPRISVISSWLFETVLAES